MSEFLIDTNSGNRVKIKLWVLNGLNSHVIVFSNIFRQWLLFDLHWYKKINLI